MEFELKQLKILALLVEAQIAKKTVAEFLSYVYMRQEGNSVICRAFGGESQFIYNIPVAPSLPLDDVESPTLDVALCGHTLYRVMKSVTAKSVTGVSIEESEGVCTLTVGKTQHTFKQPDVLSVSKQHCLGSKIASCSYSKDSLASMLKRLSPYMANAKNLNPRIRGICLEFLEDGSSRATATDGFCAATVKMSSVDLEVYPALNERENKNMFIIPREEVMRLKAHLTKLSGDAVQIHLYEDGIGIQCQDFVWETRCVDNKYPSLDHFYGLCNEETHNYCSFLNKEMAKATKDASITLEPKTVLMTLERHDQEIVVSCVNSKGEKTQVPVLLESKAGGELFAHVNYQYLQTALSVLGEKVTLFVSKKKVPKKYHVVNEVNPLRLVNTDSPDSFMVLLMPMCA